MLPPAHPDRHRLRDEAIEMGIPPAASLARRYAGRGEPLDDLQQVALLGLVKAVDGFDSAYATDFWVYAAPTITGEIKRHFRDKTWAVHVPRRCKDLRQDIIRCRDDLIQQLRRLPRVADFAAHLGKDPDEITRALLAGNANSTISLSTPPRRGHRGNGFDRLGEREPGYDLVDLHASIHPALGQLSVREWQIITMRFFRQMTQSQIAAEIGVSQVHISRILTRVLQQLRESLRDAC